MFLRNYDNLIAGLLTIPGNSDTGSDSSVFGDGYINIKGENGTIYKVYNKYQTMVPFRWWGISGDAFRVGTGTTAATYNDYALESPVTVTFSNLSQGTVSYNSSTGKWEETVTMDFLNNTGDSLSITELGIERLVYYGYSTTTTIIIAREVLATPITVINGAYGRVSFTYEVPSNPNKP